MKALISGIKRMEIHDGDGIRTTVFFKGCPLKCVWCHNPDSISYKKQIALFEKKCMMCASCAGVCDINAINMGKTSAKIDFKKCVQCGKCADICPTGAIFLYGNEYSIEELYKIVMQDEPFYISSGGGVTLSGGECLTQAEFVTAFAKKLFENKISVNIDTCGYVERGILEKIMPYVDTFLYDIKAIDADVHKKCTGRSNAIILDNLKYLSESGCSIEIRYPLVKGYNDEECEKIGAFLKDLKGIKKVKVLKYHSFAASRYEALGMKNTLPNTETTIEDVENAVKTLKKYGINAVNGVTEE